MKTFIATITHLNTSINSSFTNKAHTQYLAMLVHHTQDLCIPDGGADSHVGGQTWLPLSPLSGPRCKVC